MQRWEVRDAMCVNGWFEYATAKAAWKAAYHALRATRRVFGKEAQVTVTCLYADATAVQRWSYTLDQSY
jgi:hypothetical protein